MQHHPYYKWIPSAIACVSLLLFAFFLFHGTSLASDKSPLATPTPRPTMISVATPQTRPTPTIIVITQSSSFSDPSSIIALLSLVVAAVTLFFIIKYVRDTAVMAKATRDSADATLASARAAENTLQEMKEARDEEMAPFVVVYFHYIHSRHQSLYLVIENIGKNVARDITLEFTPPLQVSRFNRDRIENNSLLKNGLKSLAPHYKIPIPFDYLMHYLHGNFPMEYTVKVTYWWKTPLQPVVFEYPLDLALFKYTDFVTETGLGEINETLQNLGNNFGSYQVSTDTTNNLLNHIANAINRGLVIKNRLSVSQDNVDIPTILKEFIYLWTVDYGKQKEKWNTSFIFVLRARCNLIEEGLLKCAVSLDSHVWSEQLEQIISKLSRLSSMRLTLDSPEGTFSSASMFFSAGNSKEAFDNLGDSIIADIRTVIDLIDKEQETPLIGENKENAQSPTKTEETD